MPLSDDETDIATLLSPVISLRNFNSSFAVAGADSWCVHDESRLAVNNDEDVPPTISAEEAFGQDLTSAE